MPFPQEIERDGKHMDRHQDQQHVDPPGMEGGGPVDPFVGDLERQGSVHHAGVGVGREETGHDLGQHGEDQDDDHRAAHRVVADVARPLLAEEMTDMGERRRRALQEVREAGRAAAHEAPDDAEQQQRQDGVARPEV